MTDSTGALSETHSASSANERTETRLAQASDQVQVSEPSVGTTIQLVAAGDSLQLSFDPADVAKAEVKDGNLEITFESGCVAVVQGYEEWAAAGGQPTGPQGGAVDVAQLGQPAAPAVCDLPGENVHVVDVPVPSEGERLTLAVAPGDALRLACSFRDVQGAEVGNNLEMTFPGGGVVVVQNFSAWIAAQGASISDCVCGGVNPADFIVALGLNPEDVLPAAGGEGPAGPLPADSPSFTPGPGPAILHSFDHPHILPPTALGYGGPDAEQTFLPLQEQDDVPTANPTSVTVEEDNLAGGIDENSTISETATGLLGLDFGADQPGKITAGSYAGPQLTSGGSEVVVTFDDSADTFSGTADGEVVFTAVLDPGSNHYTFALFGPLDHPVDGLGGDEQELGLSFKFVATDADGESVNAGFVVNVRDDVPVATPDEVSAVTNTINLVVVFDHSGSMDEDPNAPGFTTRIDLARAAVASMLAAYESVANVNILVVDFADSAANSGWLSGAAAANAYLAGLDAEGTTDYNAAIQEVISSYNSGLPDAGQTLVYFLSDGKPLPSDTSLAASGTVDEWESFLSSQGIDTAFAVGIGTDVSDADGDLSDVAFPNGIGNNVIIVSDESDTFDALVATVVEAGGNVFSDAPPDQFGGDGPGTPQIVSIKIDGVLYEFDGAQITKDGDFVGLGSTLIAPTALGGELIFDFSDGDYSYDLAGPGAGGQEQFVYTIMDNDGDTSFATLTIDLDGLQVTQPNRVIGTDGNDTTLTGSVDRDVMGGGDGHDVMDGGDGDDHISGGAGADTISGGNGNDIIVGGNQGEVTDSPGTVRPSGTDLADVIDGGKGNDVIYGNEGPDTLNGGTGNDTIFGGIGNDEIAGGQGDDVTNLGAGGGSDIVKYNSTLDGHDIVNGFRSGPVGQDFFNLDGLFDSLGATTSDRAGHVQIVDKGSTVDVNVDADGNAGNGFELTVVTLTTTGTITVGTGPNDDVQVGTL